jgi:hypothetical protein
MMKCGGVLRDTKLWLMLLLSLTEPGRALGAGHWAFQPIVRPPVPEARGRLSLTRNPIDSFIEAKLSQQGLALSPAADRCSLIRRLSFDLRGLPPTPEEVDAFLADERADAYDRVVDRFLAAPQYGERWGRHWLDIAAYADSNGYFSADSDRPLAWKYRDFVVRSLDADKPFDRFIQEQIAGDELAGYTHEGDLAPEMVDPIVATHFWRNAPDGTGESDGNPLEVKVDRSSVIEGDVQLLGSAFLGLTLQCARCHNHKFEPVTQEEYYALQAIIRPAFDPDRWLKPNERTVAIGPRAAREKNERDLAEHERSLKTLKESLEGLAAPFRKQLLEENLIKLDESSRKALQQALDTKEKDRSDAMKALLKTNVAIVEIDESALVKRFTEFASASQLLREAIQRRESSAPKPIERISVLAEPTNAPSVHHLLVRGNHAQEGKEIEPGVPAVLSMNSPKPTGRRLTLARWLTSPDNPIVPALGRADQEIFVMNADGSSSRAATANRSINTFPNWSPSGESILYTSYRFNNRPLLFVSTRGKGKPGRVLPRIGERLGIYRGVFAPSGPKLALVMSDGDAAEIYSVNLDGRDLRRLTNNRVIDVSPSWSPDGSRIAFVSDRTGSPQVYLMNADGSDQKRLTFEGSYNSNPAWSPDGRWIAYETRLEGQFDIWLIDPSGATKVPLVSHPRNDEGPSWAPNARKLAFSSTRRGRADIYVVDLSGDNLLRLTENAGNNTNPSWGPFPR